MGCLKTFGQTKQPNKTKPISKGGSETFNFVWFSRGFVWFSFVSFCICGFPECFDFLTLREMPKKQTRPNPYPRVGLKPLTCVWSVFPKLSFVFFNLVYGICGFPEGFFCFLKKPSGKPANQTRPNPYPRVGLKPLNTLVVRFYRMCFWCSLVYFVIVGFPTKAVSNTFI